MFRLFKKLKSLDLKIYHTTTAFFALAALPLLLFSAYATKSSPVYADSTISKLFFTYGGEVFNLKTKEGSVLGAVKEAGISVYDQDTFSVDRNTKLYGQSLVFEIKKSWPVVIYDGTKRIEGRSSSADPREVLRQNRIEVWPEDKVSDELDFSEATENPTGQVIKVIRAPKFTILVDDTEIVVRSWGSKIGDIIKDKVVLGPRDIVSPPVNNSAVPQDIVVTRINVVETTENVAIPFGTSYRDDYFTPKGNNVTLTSGSNGSKQRNLKITYKNGVEVSRVVTSESVLKNPVNAVVKRGLMPSTHPDFKRVWWDIMVAAGTKYGISPLSLFKVAACESHVNPNSANTKYGYYGMYQYNLGFWSSASSQAGYPGAAWNNGTAQIYATAKYASQNGWGRWGCKP